jgi:putative ABC transport system ATP-binding protein
MQTSPITPPFGTPGVPTRSDHTPPLGTSGALVAPDATPPLGMLGTPPAPDYTPPSSAAAGQPLLELEGVSRVYGEEIEVYALRDVTLRISAGEFVSIVGPSGSGKSTMLGLLGLLDQPSSGTVWVGGQDVNVLDDPARSRVRGDSIGFVFQQFHLIPHLTALGNVETALLYRSLRPKERRERALAALEHLGLGARANHLPVQMSGGEQQRVALARAIVTDPLVILADEPTGALDSANAAHVLRLFQTLQSPQRAVVVVTHDAMVADTAHRKVSMRDGRIVGDDPTAAATA